MKTLLLVLLLLPAQLIAQDWKKSCVMSSGDTLNVGDSVRINYSGSLKVMKYIMPRPGRYDGLSTGIYLRHLGAFMQGNTYEIKEFSRIKGDDGDMPLVVIEDEWADPGSRVFYIVYINQAVRDGIVTVSRKP